MTEAEIEALLDAPDDGEDKEIGELLTGETETTAQEPKQDEEAGEDAGEDATPPASADQDDSPTDSEADSPAAETAEPPSTTSITPQPAEREFEQERAQLDQRRAALEEQYYNQGDISEEQFRAEMRKLEWQMHDLSSDQTLHRQQLLQHQLSMQAIAQQFIASHAEYQTYPGRLQLLQVEAQRLEAANPNIDPHALLQQAHASVYAQLGLELPSKAASQPKAKAVELPPTLGGLPSAADSDDSSSLFAKLDTLTGDEYEEALAKLPEATVERYLGSV